MFDYIEQKTNSQVLNSDKFRTGSGIFIHRRIAPLVHKTAQTEKRYGSVPHLDKFVINGGLPLKGEVTVSGPKNAAVAIIPAVILVIKISPF